MRPKGTIYRQGKSTRGAFQISMNAKQVKRYRIFRIAGALIASLSITSLVYFWSPILVSDLDLMANRSSYVEPIATVEPSQPIEQTQNNVEPEPKPQVVVDKNMSIDIPILGASSSVIKNVNAYDQDEYLSALEKGVAHAKGTGLPGEGKRIYLFAHSTNSPANFSLINAVFYQLRHLEEGDKIMTSYGESDYTYEVTNSLIVDATDTSWLNSDSIGEQLVLQTCDPPGTTLKRLLVFAKPV